MKKKIVKVTLYFLKIPIFCVNVFFVGETQLEELYLLLLFYATDSWLRNISSKHTMGSNRYVTFLFSEPVKSTQYKKLAPNALWFTY